MQHNPTLHIFIGQDHHFFTLRESYLHVMYIGRNPKPYYEVRYSHIKNLSQNWDEAVEKAKEASLVFGIPLHVRESKEEQLKEIKRRSEEEIEQQRRMQEEEYRQAEAEAQARRREYWNSWKVEALNLLNGNVHEDATPLMPIGAYCNNALDQVPTSYLQWMVHSSGLCDIDAEELMHKPAFVAQWIRDNMEIAAPQPSNWVGNLGEKMEMEMEVEVDSVRCVTGYYGDTYLYKILTKTGDQLTWFASRPALDGIKKAKLKFTIKKHDEYNGVKQTMITRAKIA